MFLNISLKVPGPIASDFLITPGEFYSWKMYHLEEINESVTSYGNHN